MMHRLTQMAVVVYFAARLAHYVVYTLGVPLGRTLSFTVAWGAHQLPAWLARQAPQPRATTYNVYVNGVSVHSGPSRRYALDLFTPALQRGCVRIAVSAFYSTLGWTERSEPLHLNECPTEAHMRDAAAAELLGEGEVQPLAPPLPPALR